MRKFTIDGKVKLIIADSALNELYKYDPQNYNYENGGILLGKFEFDKNLYKITCISGTNHRDKKGKCFFIRNKDASQIIINKYWTKSEGEINYLGEWHTHNEIKIKPSIIDLQLLKQIIHNKNKEFDYVFLIILGINNKLYVATINDKNEIKELKEE